MKELVESLTVLINLTAHANAGFCARTDSLIRSERNEIPAVTQSRRYLDSVTLSSCCQRDLLRLHCVSYFFNISPKTMPGPVVSAYCLSTL
jgi:hypothetical protein